MSLIKSEKEIELMRESCGIVSAAIKHIKEFVKQGVTTAELDNEIESFIVSKNAVPAFKGYGASGKRKGFPSSACISINEEVVHGLPSDRKLKDGDIVSVDVGVLKNGYYGDSAYTFGVGKISSKMENLLKVTEKSLYKGIEKAVSGNTINDIAVAVQTYVEGSGYSVVRDLVGHGIGKKLHEEPAVPNFYSTANNFILKKGMTIAIEPMVNYGEYMVETLNDGWTIVTKDREPSAHFEHTVLIKDGVAEILTI
ncbi:MAG: type I methionyl aminopeptidase [Ignavibacteria bacterium]|jgi:methionyl aminopeptidase|nr:type I methionyl aminopeptidase [Ignavibacteria bacterium]